MNKIKFFNQIQSAVLKWEISGCKPQHKATPINFTDVVHKRTSQQKLIHRLYRSRD